MDTTESLDRFEVLREAGAMLRDGLEVKSTNPKDVLGIKRCPLWLIPGPAKVHAAMAHLDGARKYGPYNWREEGVSASVYLSAAMRHIQDYLDGEQVAPDSRAHHLGHAIACLNIILDAEALGNLMDDRPPTAPTADMMEALKQG